MSLRLRCSRVHSDAIRGKVSARCRGNVGRVLAAVAESVEMVAGEFATEDTDFAVLLEARGAAAGCGMDCDWILSDAPY